MSPALKALLHGFIDYAGIYPPAKLPIETAVTNYDTYQNGEYAWMLHWLVVGVNELEHVPVAFDGSLSVLAEADNSRAASMETKGVIQADRPVYCEVGANNLACLDRIKQTGCFAKIRTGGLVPDAIPAPQAVANFILACAERRLPFKATAGLHHPLRSLQSLTYEADSPKAVMHGFINVLMAAAFAWHGKKDIEPIIAETDPKAFVFDERAHFRDISLSVSEIEDARRNFIHTVGSCSFEEPIYDLQKLGLF
ncbi:MAG: hypothetical protein K2W82_10055 [Candidatus Obscuribacterales bacterium]|nr:hypothetical protein [Candidatus Obscuribacterales bacterium]